VIVRRETLEQLMANDVGWVAAAQRLPGAARVVG
jgi:hypothetical protein